MRSSAAKVPDLEETARRSTLVFDEDYREQLVLPNGLPATVRMLTPSDADLLAAGFQRLSDESRYRRFMVAKSSLSPDEIRYLTEIDGTTHFAIGATTEHPVLIETGVGIARFVCLPDAPHVAEPALVVADEYQRLGVGRLLLARLVAAARERGVREFRATMLANNVPMRDLLTQLGNASVATTDGPVLTVEVPIEPPPSAWVDPDPGTPSLLERLLRLAAQGALALGVKKPSS